jgi:hypothetical protein
MSTYKPDVIIYYGEISPENKLIPAPNITIAINYNYSNDAIIGYTYIFNISGTASALDLRNIAYGGEYNEPDNYSFGAVIDHIHKLRSILSNNGNVLHIINGKTNDTILEARGGILRSFSFDESNNNWSHTAEYSASLEFSSVDFMSSTESCDSVFLDPLSFPNGKAGIVDINSFKIKTFNDSWSFNFNETEPYNRIKTIDTGGNLDINNLSFDIEYTINAVGKNFHIYENNSSKLLPAWEQAKNFVQYRLHSQVTNLLNNVLKNSYNICSSSDGLDDINVPGSVGLLSSLGDSIYKIYNEQITCEASESDGSFSATYSATVKSVLGNTNWSHPATTHSIDKSVQISTNDGKITKTISINGTIQGLLEGGLIRINKVIQLPNQGSITLLNNITDNKYNNAKLVLDKIYSDVDYSGGQGACGKRDLKSAFKNILGITVQELTAGNQGGSSTPTCPPPCTTSDAPHPSSFNLTHDYINGTITYKVEYNSDDANCQDGSNAKFSQISIQTNMPTKVFAVFNIPNSNSCPVIQELGTYTAKTVSVTISGNDSSCTGKPNTVNFSNLIQCGGCFTDGYFPVPLPSGDYILTQKQYTNNPVDGSFTINLGYICATGCDL